MFFFLFFFLIPFPGVSAEAGAKGMCSQVFATWMCLRSTPKFVLARVPGKSNRSKRRGGDETDSPFEQIIAKAALALEQGGSTHRCLFAVLSFIFFPEENICLARMYITRTQYG